MQLKCDFENGKILISYLDRESEGSISIPIIEIGNELMKNDAFVNSLYDKFRRIEKHERS